ncbi:hypothetical protein SNEBB_004991 [Seison nebaliae]|nr:hypothetical protein SNEBB_004991 [Seison nebaliae]
MCGCISILIILKILLVQLVRSDCVWYGECIDDKDHRYNCAYNGKAKDISNVTNANKLIEKYCPWMDTKSLCCDVAQLETLQKNFALPDQLLEQCPACYHNFRRLMCEMTCSSTQSNFIVVNEYEKETYRLKWEKRKNSNENFFNAEEYYDDDADDEKDVKVKTRLAVSNISMIVSHKFSVGLFKSCNNVKFAGDPVLNILCGSAECTPQKWLDFLGHENPLAPFPIYYLTTNQSSFVYNTSVTLDVMNAPIWNCADHIDTSYATAEPCSCNDCLESCSVYPDPSKKSFRILMMNGYAFIVAIIFSLSTTFFICIAVYKETYRTKNDYWKAFNYKRKKSSMHGEEERNKYGTNTNDDNSPIHHSQEEEIRNPSLSYDGIMRENDQETLLNINISAFEESAYGWEMKLAKGFYRLGYFVAKYPSMVLIASLLIFSGISVGIRRSKLITDPVDLWSDASSTTRQQKQYFDDHFSPFYRIEQFMAVPKNKSQYTNHKGVKLGPVFNPSFFKKMLRLQNELTSIVVNVNGKNVGIKDICVAPLKPDNDECAIQSIYQYWQNNYTKIEMKSDQFDFTDHLQECLQNPSLTPGKVFNMSCLSAYGGPTYGFTVLGAYPNKSYELAEAINVIIPVNNFKQIKKFAVSWEGEFLKILKNFSDDQIDIYYTAQRSIEDEIARESKSDMITILISYIVMFVYVTFSLGHIRRFTTLLIDIKLTASFGGIILVFLSVMASIGFWSFVDVPGTLIIYEVIPFFALAVGVDNIFILVQTFLRNSTVLKEYWNAKLRKDKDPNDVIIEHFSKAMANIGPSMLLTSSSECGAFSLGALSKMPAVRTFSLYATAAVLFDFLLQITAFSALLVLDVRRQANMKFDLCYCFQSSYATQFDKKKNIGGNNNNHNNEENIGGNNNNNNNEENIGENNKNNNNDENINEISSDVEKVNDEAIVDELSSIIENGRDQKDFTDNISKDKIDDVYPIHDRESYLYKFFSLYYAPNLLFRKSVRITILVIFFLWFAVGIARIPKVEIGLDQQLSMPYDSYQIDYFNALNKYLNVGPPVYFVIKNGFNYSENGQKLICGTSGCDRSSLLNQISLASTADNITYIANSPSSWIDDYYAWSTSEACCRVYKNSGFPGKFCPSSVIDKNCIPCNISLINNRPTDQSFQSFLPFYLKDNPNSKCAKGGHAAYAQLVNLKINGLINASAFMGYHSVLRNSSDFIKALSMANRISENITQLLKMEENNEKIEVFPYSVFYVYYEQYLTIWRDSAKLLGSTILVIFVVTFVLLALDYVTAFLVILTIIMIITSILTTMHMWNIPLNGVSLLNLVMSVGISVEFCSHIARSFAMSIAPFENDRGDKVFRAYEALSTMGSSVFSGITLTKLGGIVVLGFSTSQLFQIFYFRMYLAMVIFGGAHGLIFLPVLLSYFGPKLNAARLKPKNFHN